MIAVPKNQAMTMLLSGTIGYTPAINANQEDGKIILSAGGSIDDSGGGQIASKLIDPGLDASIDITNANFTTLTDIFANNNLTISADGSATGFTIGDQFRDNLFTAGGTIRFEAENAGANINFIGRTRIDSNTGVEFFAGVGGSITADSDIFITANNRELGSTLGDPIAGSAGHVGGTISFTAMGDGTRTDGSGEIRFGGRLTADSSVTGVRSSRATLADGSDTVGGNINITVADGGLFSLNENAGAFRSIFDAGASPNVGTDTAGSSTGGTITVDISGTETIFNGGIGSVELDARGDSGSNFRGTASGGTNTGGAINFNVTDATINGSLIELDAGSNGTSNASGNTNESVNGANAGNLNVGFTNATVNLTSRLTFNNEADAARSINAAGEETDSPVNGGIINMTIDNTQIDVNQFQINNGLNGFADTTTGSITLNLINGTTLTTSGRFELETTASGATFGSNGRAVSTGDINLLVDNATLDVGSALISTGRNTAAPASATDDGTTGTVSIDVQNGGTITGSGFVIDAGASSDTAGGQATGGDVIITIDNGTIDLVDGTGGFPIGSAALRISASGVGAGNDANNNPDERGVGIGGNVTVNLLAGGTLNLETFFANTDGAIGGGEEGPPAIIGQGGDGIGGTTTFNLLGGTFNAGDVTVSSSGFASFGGNSTNGLGAGGDATGGDVVFNLQGANVTVDNLTVSADGVGGDGGSSSDISGANAEDGGFGTGGNATFNANSGTLTVNNTLTVSAGGFGGAGGQGSGVDGGAGGDSLGGTAIFDLDGTATIDVSTINVSASSTGGTGGNVRQGVAPAPTPAPAGRAGDGGLGQAGTAIFNNTSGNVVNLTSISATAVGTGGAAGRGGQFVFDPTLGTFTFVEQNLGQSGGNGGDGIGGTATINLGQDDSTPRNYIVDASGVGAAGSSGSLAGADGGDGTGGIATLNILDSAVDLDDPEIRASGTGGAGAVALGDGGFGGNGGSGTGGTATLELTGAGSSLPVGGGFVINADGSGGAAGDGTSSLFASGGNGGDGGNGVGGTAEILVRSGASVTIDPAATLALSAVGTGSDGGAGGNSDTSTDVGGDGGDGGDGTGGTLRLLAQGGTISSGDINLVAQGDGGAGGGGGADTIGGFGASGVGGIGNGGTTSLEIEEGSPGILTLADTTINVSGTGGTAGRVVISDTSTDPLGPDQFRITDP